MKTYDLIQTKLENFPEFRERKYRGKYLAILALRATGLEERHKENRVIDISEMAGFAIAYASLERMWRKVTSEHKELQGKDYFEKGTLEEEKMLELEYTPGIEQISKVNSKL